MEIFKKINIREIDKDEINIKLSLLPKHLQTKISKYVIEEKKQQRIDGLELLGTALIKNKMDINLIDSINYNTFGKPFINHEIDFSLSYSGNNTILGFVKNGIIGVDIERLKAIDYNLFKDYFTQKEWDYIHHDSFVEANFFKLWTRKEAVVKAIGKGVYFDLSTINIINNHIKIDEKMLYLSTEFLENGCCFSVACTQRV